MKDSFILYTAQYEALKELTTEQKGQLLDCLFQYASTGTMPAMTDEAVRVAANFLRIQIDMDSGKYEKKCERNKEIALERERRRKEQRNSTNVHERTRTYTNVHDNDNKNDNENDNENNNENNNENENNNIEAKASLNNLNTHTDTHAREAGEEKKENRNPWLAPNEETAFALILQFFNKCVKLYQSDIKPVRAITDERRVKLRIILKKYKSEHLKVAISNAMQSAFLNGRTKRRKQAADFDWIFEEKHFVQCMENAL